jgi:hypothetical protein
MSSGHDIAVYVTADENLYVAQIKRQSNALPGYSVVAALGRLTFAKNGSLTVSAQSPARELDTSAALWLSGHSLLVELGTQPILSGGKLTGATGRRLFMLDTGSRSTYLTDLYLAEHTNVFSGPHRRPLSLPVLVAFTKSPRLELVMSRSSSVALLSCSMAPHILTQSAGGESENFFGLIGQDVVGLFTSYTIDFRNMTLTVPQ